MRPPSCMLAIAAAAALAECGEAAPASGEVTFASFAPGSYKYQVALFNLTTNGVTPLDVFPPLELQSLWVQASMLQGDVWTTSAQYVANNSEGLLITVDIAKRQLLYTANCTYFLSLFPTDPSGVSFLALDETCVANCSTGLPVDQIGIYTARKDACQARLLNTLPAGMASYNQLAAFDSRSNTVWALTFSMSLSEFVVILYGLDGATGEVMAEVSVPTEISIYTLEYDPVTSAVYAHMANTSSPNRSAFFATIDLPARGQGGDRVSSAFQFTRIGPVGAFDKWRQINTVSALSAADGTLFATMFDQSTEPATLYLVGTNLTTGTPNYEAESPDNLPFIDMAWHA